MNRLVGDYRILEPLGEGGMAFVFLALDTRLNRQVVLKWLKDHTPESVERLQREAHLQSRLEHPAVCRVYAITEHEGWPYLVIQYIQGKTLDLIGPELNLETKLRLMITLADAVHTAHRKGLIHRDLKPTNFMVEPDEAGGWRPYVMDFGLAKRLGPNSLTEEGALVGTPAYMAPEQISGAEADCRTDVYGLGATLFELLSGRPPFGGTTLSEILLKVQDQEAPLLRKISPDLSKDLETVLQNCLAKDPARRYPSAAALRDDLQHILDGEAIQARRASFAEKSRRWIRKNRLASTLAAIVIASLLVTGGLWFRQRQKARIQTYWAQRFGQEVIRMEDELRFGRMLPAHDLSEEFEQVRQRMNVIRDQMDRNKDGQGPAHFALGEGHLMLDEYETARTELEAAWNGGYRSPEVSLALGSCCLNIYYEAHQEALNIPDIKARSVRESQLRKDYLEAARHHLDRAKRELGGLPQLEEVLLALVEDRFQDASTLAQSVYNASPWRYEVLMEVARSLSYQSKVELEKGHLAKAKGNLESALTTLDSIQKIGPSDDRIFDVMASVWLDGWELELRGQDSRSCLEHALASNERSMALNGQAVGREKNRGEILIYLAEEARRRAEDPEPWYRRAEASLTKVLEVIRSNPAGQTTDAPIRSSRSDAFSLLIRLYGLRALRLDVSRNDIRPLVEKGLHYYQLAQADGQINGTAHYGMALLYLGLSRQQEARGEDRSEALEHAAGAFKKYKEFQPDPVNIDNLARILLDLANIKMDRDQDPESYIKRANNAIREAMDLAPGLSNNHCLAGDSALLEAQWMKIKSLDPLPVLEKARMSYELARKADKENNAWRPVDTFYWPGLAQVHALLAEEHIARREDPVPDALKAIAYGRKAKSVKAKVPEHLRQALAQAGAILRVHQHKKSPH